ncbi:MAG: helix-turn-helix transcriptional regulator [Brockia lithotrophica]|nr:helix-turn-helix transcriptional regulator [Brockia lithotrophica]MBT9253919.1 helix-turn-helix transcriptional regulator [Brockia lithotrophica]
MLDVLTAREREVVYLIGQGYRNRDIAQALVISEHTVKNHISNIFQKLGVADRYELLTLLYGSETEER